MKSIEAAWWNVDSESSTKLDGWGYIFNALPDGRMTSIYRRGPFHTGTTGWRLVWGR